MPDMSDYLSKEALSATGDWNMDPSSSITLAFGGSVSNLMQGIMEESELARVTWYMTAGENPSE